MCNLEQKHWFLNKIQTANLDNHENKISYMRLDYLKLENATIRFVLLMFDAK